MRYCVTVVVTVLDMVVVTRIVLIVRTAQEVELVKEFVNEAGSSLVPSFSSFLPYSSLLFHELWCSSW